MAAVNNTRSGKLQRWGLLLRVGLPAGAWLFLAFRSPQPSYGGRNLTEWLVRLEAKGEEDQEAVLAVRQIGTNAIPFLMKMMRSEDSRLKRHLIGMLQMQRIIKFRIMDEARRHMQGAMGFAALGPIAQ